MRDGTESQADNLAVILNEVVDLQISVKALRQIEIVEGTTLRTLNNSPTLKVIDYK